MTLSTKKPVTKTKYATTILVKCRSPPLNQEEVFASLFFKSFDLSDKARTFYMQVVQSKGIPEKEWKSIIKRLNTDRGTYYHMISKLRGAGLVEKREGLWVEASHFRTWLEQVLRQIAAMNGYNAIITYERRI